MTDTATPRLDPAHAPTARDGGRGVAVVTGAGRGLGAAIADRLERDGFTVVRADVAGAPVPLDVTDAEACRRLAAETDPDVWVNNAGVLGAGDAATQPQDEVDRVIDVNLRGVLHGTRAAVAVMRERDGGRGRGRIITVGSLASWAPTPGLAVYGATKAGVLSYTMALHSELRAAGVTGVHLSVVCPDGMLTPMITSQLDNPAVNMSFTGLRMVRPEQVAERVSRLLGRHRLVASVPRWRGLQVRLIGAAPDLVVRAAPLFGRIGEGNRRRVAARLGEPRA